MGNNELQAKILRLEQENKDLKKQIESDKGLITIGGKQQYEYLQRIDELKQENKELKIYIESNKQQVEEAEMLVMDNDRLQQEVENLKDIIYYDIEKYRSALEEIREVAIGGADVNDCTFCNSIFKKINEVLS